MKWPFLVPVEWSVDGPVPAEAVLVALTQSKLSLMSSVFALIQVHSPFSKSQSPGFAHAPFDIRTSSIAMSLVKLAPTLPSNII
jgi:hypothetical protein